MASLSSHSLSHVDLDALIQSLPACKRCRDCRRGCDTLLPKCKQCTKANVECMFYDHGRDELLPRSYIAELVDHVRRIYARKQPSPTSPMDASHELSALPTARTESDRSDQYHRDHYFADAAGSYRYLGSESCLVKSPKLQQTALTGPDMLDDDQLKLVLSEPFVKNFELVEKYLEAVHPLYHILDPSLRYLLPDPPTDLEPNESFCLNMIYSIGCHLVPGSNPGYNFEGKLHYSHANAFKYRTLGKQFFQAAMVYLEASTMEPTISTLRAVLLLAINSLFEPKDGNIGQQVALATRIALNLEMQELSPADTEMIRYMHKAIFSLENEIASVLDRPATFPEPDDGLSFNPGQPSDYLCSLYRLQHRFRKGDESMKRHLPPFDSAGVLHPSLRMALHQTHLLVNPCWGSAWHVLEAVVSLGSVHVFLTPHWVYRAGSMLIANMVSIREGNLIQLYSNALVVLELSDGKWPSSAALAASLAELMTQMKDKYQPNLESTLTAAELDIWKLTSRR